MRDRLKVDNLLAWLHVEKGKGEENILGVWEAILVRNSAMVLVQYKVVFCILLISFAARLRWRLHISIEAEKENRLQKTVKFCITIPFWK